MLICGVQCIRHHDMATMAVCAPFWPWVLVVTWTCDMGVGEAMVRHLVRLSVVSTWRSWGFMCSPGALVPSCFPSWWFGNR